MQNMMVQAQVWPDTDTSNKTDNKATVYMIQNTYGTKRRRFIDLRHHFIRQKLKEGRTTVSHVQAIQKMADMMTKPLKRLEFQRQ